MKKVGCLVFLVSAGSCQMEPLSTEITGDLYFGVFRIGSFYNQPEHLVKSWQSHFDTTHFELRAADEQLLCSHYQKIKAHDLLYKPSVDLLINEDSVVRVYLKREDYDRIKIHKRQQLQDQMKKVEIKCEVMLLNSGLYKCVDLKSVKVVDGETFQIQKKLKVDDCY